MYRNILGRINSDADLIPLYAQHSDGYLVTDHQCLSNSARQNQHIKLLRVLHQKASDLSRLLNFRVSN